MTENNVIASLKVVLAKPYSLYLKTQNHPINMAQDLTTDQNKLQASFKRAQNQHDAIRVWQGSRISISAADENTLLPYGLLRHEIIVIFQCVIGDFYKRGRAVKFGLAKWGVAKAKHVLW